MSLTARLPIDEIILLAKQKMADLGIQHYSFKHRTIKLDGKNPALDKDGISYIYGYAEYWFLKQEVFGVDIESEYGISGEQRVNYNELVAVHTGKITIRNYTPGNTLIEFLQVIPTRK